MQNFEYFFNFLLGLHKLGSENTLCVCVCVCVCVGGVIVILNNPLASELDPKRKVHIDKIKNVTRTPVYTIPDKSQGRIS